MKTLLPVRRVSRDPWDAASDLERVFDAMTLFDPRRMIREEGLWHPTMDIYNRKDELVVELEIPGIKPEDIDITVEDNHLIVEGSRSRSSEFSDDERYYSERLFGKLHRVVHLPTDVDDAKSKASFRDGMLVVRLPKKKREGGRKIQLETK